MHIRSKHTALAALVLCAGLASMHTVSAEDKRAVTVEKRAVGAFTAIELAGPGSASVKRCPRAFFGCPN